MSFLRNVFGERVSTPAYDAPKPAEGDLVKYAKEIAELKKEIDARRPRRVSEVREEHTNVELAPKPEPISDTTIVPLDTYSQLARELDYNPPTMLVQELRNFMAANSLPIYDTDQVEAYMASLAKKADKDWHWYPLRDMDRSREITVRSTFKIGRVFNGSTSLYSKEVPIHVLRLISRIPKHLRDEFGFFVTDYSVPNPDPFLMAVPFGRPNRELITVIAVWDEPGFGVEEEQNDVGKTD